MMPDLSSAALFSAGLIAFNADNSFEAHEHREDLWSLHQLPDRDFVQGLIQLAVGCFHLTNDNLNGARGLFAMCLPKLEAASTDTYGCKNLFTGSSR